ncbi:glycoside hydrolase family 15 protein [Geomesophilobacter sediminis]|uniref:Glycoside hydrolase family 15 protein n=1 Tax=Geomesophilobacter sediminis TaxID=2798584 RepID=A0A8J7JBH8_9BACT|nr:glycoside hydrolase family 15 protein [Geomesophilobacter sediminis]MBJ6723938.1 glycoside hydrolase family 15 protein [Geomesophilobacter sediminis]
MDEVFSNLEDYGVIGNQETCAVIGRNGSVDWLPLPYLDSPSVFAGILDPDRGGTFGIAPALKFQSVQRYLQNSNVLVTDFTTAMGEASLTDFMPPLEAGLEHRMLLRKIHGKRRDSTFRVTFHPRFDYGRTEGKVRREGAALVAHSGRITVKIFGGELDIKDGAAAGKLTLHEHETAWVVLVWGEGGNAPEPRECERLLKRTVRFWQSWSEGHQRSESVHHELCVDLAVRSGLALRLLVNPGTGGIAAAGTLGLPESIGGIRNWDYRFAWIRDASFTAQALFHLGYAADAAKYRHWVLEILRRVENLEGLQPFYPLHAEAQTEEGLLDGLSGYRFSAPVRVGNKASRQTQLDIYGELVNTVFETWRFGGDVEPQVWKMVQRICEFVLQNWDKKDRGIWEMRTDPRHYVHSKLMCWVALDRASRLATQRELKGPVAEWRAGADKIKQAILDKGFSKRLNSFVQAFGGEDLDATALLVPIHRLLPPDDPRVHSSIDAVMEGLSAGNGLLYRYRADDGLAGKEGAFILCSFWLVSALSVCRRTEEAERVFTEMLQHVSPLGLMSEEVDPRNGRLIGNFPQALSHIGLINAALHLGIAKGRGFNGPPPQSEEEMT